MPISGRYNDPLVEQAARDMFALFPPRHRCGARIQRFEDADVRILVQRVVHRGRCPIAPAAEPGSPKRDRSAETPRGSATNGREPAPPCDTITGRDPLSATAAISCCAPPPARSAEPPG